jgi:D-alanyl-lipoteichoic acid acyltransferase DltB (MBOAT superfamily)
MKNIMELISTGSMVLGFLGLVYLFIVVPIVNHGWTAPFRDLTMDHRDAIPKAWLGVFFLTMALYFLLTSFIQFLIMTGIRRGKLFPEE